MDIVDKYGTVASGTKAWARCKCVGQNEPTLGFYIGIHEYVG